MDLFVCVTVAFLFEKRLIKILNDSIHKFLSVIIMGSEAIL